MLDAYKQLVLNSKCKFGIVVISNKQFRQRVNKAHSGLCSDSSKHKISLPMNSLITHHQNIAPVWAFSRSKSAVPHTITSTMLVAWENRLGANLTNIVALWRYASDHTKLSLRDTYLAQLMNSILKGNWYLSLSRYGLEVIQVKCLLSLKVARPC
jgi:hypothetical protein